MTLERAEMLKKLAEAYERLDKQDETITITKLTLKRWIDDRKETRELVRKLEKELNPSQ